MVCPKCGGKTTVFDSSFNSETNEYYRARRCRVCNHEFFTMEFEVEYNEQFKKDWNNNHRLTALDNERRRKRHDLQSRH